MQTASSPADPNRKLVKTSTPGVYKRGKSYVVRYRDPAGRSRKAFARTLAEARDLKASLTADVKRGEWRVLSRVTFAEYAPEWIAGYAGRTSRGFREETRREYRRDLGLDDDGTPLLDGSGRQRGALAHFGRLRLAEVEPRDVKGYAVKLAEAGLSPASVRNALAPVRALFATAVEEGLIRSNPAAGLRIAQRVEEREDGERVKALTEEELRRLLDALPSEWRPFFALIAHTGVRISEAVGLRGGDVDFGRRYLHVRRRIYRGEVAPPKSRYGKRAIPLSQGMSQALWERRKALRPGDDEPLFASKAGTSLDPSNVFASIFKPAARRAGVGWAGFPHAPTHRCDDAVSARCKREASASVARPSLPCVHPRNLRPLAPRRLARSRFLRRRDR
jgi:integrase